MDNIPQPMEGLHVAGPPPFLSKTYEFVDDPNTDEIVSWSRGNNSFIIWDPQSFTRNILPRYFKHNNLSSFVRQLNTYGFRKVDPDKWEFANEGFIRGQRHLLKNIKRKKTTTTTTTSNFQTLESCVEVGQFGLDGEIDRLRRDKNVLMAELAKLRHQQQIANSHLKEIEQRLKETELKQRQTMSFLLKAIKNPSFLQQIVHQKEKMKEIIEEEISKKRIRRIDDHSSRNYSYMIESSNNNNNNIGFQELGHELGVDSNVGDFDDGNHVYVKMEPEEFGGFDVEFDRLAMSMQHVEETSPFDEGFWGDIF